LARLTPRHLADLRKSGLSDEQIARCRFCSLRTPAEIQKALGWERYNGELGDCLAIPFTDANGKPTGYVRLKPDRPRKGKDGKPVRYESPKGSSNLAYFPPGTPTALPDVSTPLGITEGEKKATKADQDGFPCIGLVGVWGWMKKRPKGKDGKGHGPYELIDDLARVSWRGRHVYLCFDSDAATNPSVCMAERELANILRRHGASVHVVRLPAGKVGPDGKPAKVGLDDYLVAHGSDAFRKLLADHSVKHSPMQTAKVVESPLPKPQHGVIMSTGNELPKLMQERDLVAAIRRDIATVGLVGEEDNAMLIYLIYASRLLDEPGAVITRGRSSSGKSTILKRVAALFPPEVKIEAMTMTSASWFNTAEDFFKHKVFLSGERKHSQDNAARDAGALLRQLLSEKRVNRGVSIYDQKTKSWTTVMVDREGPIAYVESTTSGSMFEEDLNRMLQLYVDDSEAQNRKVIGAIASKYDPDRPVVDVQAVITRHHEFQRHLQSLPTPRIGIPYHKVLAAKLPAAKAESRRVAQQVFTVIESIVLLHQHCREKKNGCLIATLDDYALARRLLLPSLHAALGMGKDFKKVEQLRAAKLKPVFSTPEVKAALGFKNDMGPSRLLKELVEAEILVRVTKQQGQTPASYRWANEGRPRQCDVLPTVEDVQKVFA